MTIEARPRGKDYKQHPKGLARWHSGKETACNARDMSSIPESENPLEKEMATHSSILARKVPWTEEPGGLQSMGSQKSQR